MTFGHSIIIVIMLVVMTKLSGFWCSCIFHFLFHYTDFCKLFIIFWILRLGIKTLQQKQLLGGEFKAIKGNNILWLSVLSLIILVFLPKVLYWVFVDYDWWEIETFRRKTEKGNFFRTITTFYSFVSLQTYHFLRPQKVISQYLYMIWYQVLIWDWSETV